MKTKPNEEPLEKMEAKKTYAPSKSAPHKTASEQAPWKSNGPAASHFAPDFYSLHCTPTRSITATIINH